jgi:ribosome-associated protein
MGFSLGPSRDATNAIHQLLKLAGVVEGGGDAKTPVAGEGVWVNGEREARRGRQLHRGDTVRVGAEELRVVG